MNEELKKDFEALDITNVENLTVRFVTGKYKKLAKQRHPDRLGGSKVDFQNLQNAYKRIIKYLEQTEDAKDDFEKEFFKNNNVCKECTSSYVIYIQNSECKNWKIIFGKHLKTHKEEKKKTIFKTGIFTVTIYDTPKVDSRSKIHVQSRDQQANIEFIMDKISSMYQEVANLKEQPQKALKMKQMERSLCGECGKLFTNKKGLKQHIIRTHLSKEEMCSKTKNLKESEQTHVGKVHRVEESSSLVLVHQDINEGRQLQSEDKRAKDTETHDNSDIIETLVVNVMADAVEKANDKVEEKLLEEEEEETPDTNYQCGVCGYILQNEEDANKHVVEIHTEDSIQCSVCHIDKNENVLLRNRLLEKEELNDRIVKKNEALEKENKRLKLALKQSEDEKQKLKKNMESQSEALDSALKENVVLNETIRLKESLEEEAEEVREKLVENNETEKQDQIHTCNECDYKTRVKKYMKGHKIKHTGQYICQHGCNNAFKTLTDLDTHIQNAHRVRTTKNRFSCENCDETFQEIHSMRIHMQKKHTRATSHECKYCGQNFYNNQQFRQHIAVCHEGFEVVEIPCRYFANGYCRKGNFCTFSHKKSKNNVPLCRNGPTCPYEARGVCRFSHRSQYSPNIPKESLGSRNQSKRCYYMEDCHRVPMCPFSHYEQDFPPLTKNNPPEATKTNLEGWEDY